MVTLLTDFGSMDPFVGAVKGRILGDCPQARIVDLTHEVTPYRPVEAGFWLERVRLDFPAGTVHLAIVDPGVGTGRRIIAILLDGQLLLGPDNGLLGGLAGLPGALVRAASDGLLARLNPRPSSTFHGRDLFAPLAGRLAAGALRFDAIGSIVLDVAPSTLPAAVRQPGRVLGEIVLQDHYGNLFSNIEADPEIIYEVSAVRFGAHALRPVRTYGDARPGDCVSLVNAFGVLEAACVHGNAAERLGLGVGDPVEVLLPHRAGP